MYVFHGGMVYLHTRDGGKGVGTGALEHVSTAFCQISSFYSNQEGHIIPTLLNCIPYFLENSAVPAYRYKYNSLVFAIVVFAKKP